MENLTERIDELFAQNRGAEAERLLEQALQEAYEQRNFAGAVPILNELIGYCRETSQVERSYHYADDVQEILQKLGLMNTIPHATTLLNIANAYRAGGRLEDSLQKYEEVAQIYVKLLMPEDMLWANFYNNISLLYQELGRFDLAKESLLKALGIVLQKKDTIFEQAVTYTNLANTCLQLGQGEEAEKYFTGAILLFEKYDIQDAHYQAALSAMATYLYQKQDYERAQEYFLKAMEGIEQSLGRNEFYKRMQENAKLCGELLQLQRQALKGEQDEETAAGGLALCKAYYEECCKPMLEARFPKYVDKIAVGLVGEGSDCFGYDDAFSRDHDWGPRLFLWVTDKVYEEIGAELNTAYEELPKVYKGVPYQESVQAVGRCGVQRIGDFYGKLLGTENCPVDVWNRGKEDGIGLSDEGGTQEKFREKDIWWYPEGIQWERIPEERLAAAVNGAVFVDKSGEFTQIRRILKEGCPKRLWYLKIAEAAARFSQNGQYNYRRMRKRGDMVSAGLMMSEAVREALKLLYYVVEEYPPHDKWLMRGLQKRRSLERIQNLIENIMVSDAAEDKADKLEQLGEQLAYLLYRANYISDVEGFLQEHVSELLFKASRAELSIEELAEQIAQAEFEAFDKVKNFGGRADCQDDWFTFSIMRKSQYLTWNKEMLLQYLYDFTREYAKGHNLVEEKYGRMMESTAPEEYEKLKGHFPIISQEKKQIIEEIVGLQVKWMEEFATDYPKLAGNARSIHTYEDHMFNTSYETYLRGEISTYSDKMLELYGRYIVEYVRSGQNPARQIMEQSVLMYGYENLQDAETRME
ncbi:MAG: DUF4125 family protein [Lachnospiraceae bacterium]|nr:DUF4125 family protein [Lachnospiraceae bacterium]